MAEFFMWFEKFYSFISPLITGLFLGIGFLSLLARLAGLQRGLSMSRPRALYGMIGSVAALTLFYIFLAVTGQPETIEARGGVIRLLLINHSIALVHWNMDYIRAIMHWRETKKVLDEVLDELG